MKSKTDVDVKVGILVTLGLVIFMVAILMVGGDSSLFNRNVPYFARFETGEGLIKGAKVVLSGVTIGAIEEILIQPETKNIRINVGVSKRYADLLRQSTTAEVRTMGVLGDKYIALTPGAMDDPVLNPGEEIKTKEGGGFSQILSQGETLMTSLNRIGLSLERLLGSLEKNNRNDTLFEGLAQTSKNLSSITHKVNNELDQIQIKSAVKNLNQILEKINRGTGTVGALINDPQLYDDLKLLVGEVNRNRILRNVVRQTIRDAEKEQKKPQ